MRLEVGCQPYCCGPGSWATGVGSQNHRVVEVGRELWRSSGLSPLLKQSLKDAELQFVGAGQRRAEFVSAAKPQHPLREWGMSLSQLLRCALMVCSVISGAVQQRDSYFCYSLVRVVPGFAATRVALTGLKHNSICWINLYSLRFSNVLLTSLNFPPLIFKQ